MFDKPISGKYYPTSSILHRLNPISKVLCFFLLTFSSLCVNHLGLFLLMYTLLFLLLRISKIPYRYYINGVESILVFLLLLFLVCLAFSHNLFFCFSLLCKIVYIYLFLLLLTMTTSIPDLTYGLEKALIPLQKISVDVSLLSYKITTFLLFASLVEEEKERIKDSNYVRGYKGYIWIQKIYTFFCILKNIGRNSFERYHNLLKNMKLRNFNNKRKRSNYRMNKWGIFDTIFVLVCAIIGIGIIISEVLL